MDLQRRAKRLSIIILTLLQQENLAGAKVIQARRAARYLSLGIKLFNPTELDKALRLAEPIALSSNSENVISARQSGLVVYQFQLAQGFWETYTRADLPTPQAVGLAEQRQPVAFELDPPHALIAGTTGSGKSETVKSIMLSLMTSYTPDELNLVLIDPNRDYGDLNNVAHLAMPIACEQDAIRQALAWSHRELLQRIEHNNKDDKLLVIAIDEAEQALSDKINLEFAQAIAKRGRAYNVHLIVSTQEPKERKLQGFLGQLLNRFVGLSRDARESALFTGHAGLQAHKLTGKGDFIHVAGPDVARFQVAMATRADFDRLERAEIKPIFDDIRQDIIFPDEAETNGSAGRPALTVDPIMTARYFWHNPYVITRSMARERFGATRTVHELHKNFAIEFANELKRLKEGRL